MQAKLFLLSTCCLLTVFVPFGFSGDSLWAYPPFDRAPQTKTISFAEGQRHIPGISFDYYQIMVESIHRAFLSQIRHIDGDRHQLRPRIESLRQYHAGALSSCEALSALFEQTDLAENSDLYRRAFERFTAGDVGDALLILSDDELESSLRETYRQGLNRQDPGFRQSINHYLLKARLSILQLNMEAASEYYMKAIHADRLNYEGHMEYTRFLFKLGDGNRALSFGERALELAETAKEEGLAQDLLANLFAYTGNDDKAVAAYEASRSLLGPGDNAIPRRYRIDNAISLRSRAMRHAQSNSHHKAENLFERALAICADLSERAPRVYDQEMAETHIQFAASLEVKGAYEQALVHYEAGEQLYVGLARSDENVYALNLGLVRSCIATALCRLSRSTEAELLYQASLKTIVNISDLLGDPYHPEIGEIYNSLASLYISQYRYSEADQALREAQILLQPLAIKYPTFYEPDLANTFHLKGRLYQQVYDFPQAIHAFEQALEIRRRYARSDSVAFRLALAESMTDIGALYVANNQFDLGIRSMNGAVDLYKGLSEEIPAAYLARLAGLMSKLGATYASTYQHDLAEETLLASKEMLLAAHPLANAGELADCQRQLGRFYRVFGDYPAAEAAFEQAHTLLQDLAGLDSVQYSTDLQLLLLDMAVLDLEKENKDAAYGVLVETVQELERWVLIHPRSHLPLLARARRQLAETLLAQKRIERAQELLSELLAIQEGLVEVLPEVHMRELAHVYFVMGRADQMQNRYRQSSGYYLRAIELLEQLEAAYGEWVIEDIIRFRHAFANAYRDYGAFDMAAIQYRKASRTYQQLAVMAPGAFDGEYARILFDRGQLLLAQKRYEEAFDMYSEAADIDRVLAAQYEGYYNHELAEILGYMAWCRVFTRDFESAESFMKEAVSLDNSQNWLHLKQAPISLLSGAFADAKAIYLEYLSLLPEAREVFLADLTLLEQSGLEHPDMKKARKLLERAQ